jgi:hypothetical protein
LQCTFPFLRLIYTIWLSYTICILTYGNEWWRLNEVQFENQFEIHIEFNGNTSSSRMFTRFHTPEYESYTIIVLCRFTFTHQDQLSGWRTTIWLKLSVLFDRLLIDWHILKWMAHWKSISQSTFTLLDWLIFQTVNWFFSIFWIRREHSHVFHWREIMVETALVNPLFFMQWKLKMSPVKTCDCMLLSHPPWSTLAIDGFYCSLFMNDCREEISWSIRTMTLRCVEGRVWGFYEGHGNIDVDRALMMSQKSMCTVYNIDVQSLFRVRILTMCRTIKKK